MIKRFAILIVMAFAAGCVGGSGSVDRGVRPRETAHTHLGLNDIGERSIENGRRLEANSKIDSALVEYRQAVWAFEYQTLLTGRRSLYIDDAKDSISRIENEQEN